MQTLHLLVEDDYIEEFVNSFSKDKIIIVEKEFEENKIILQDTLDYYTKNENSFKPYYESMNDVNLWLKERAV